MQQNTTTTWTNRDGVAFVEVMSQDSNEWIATLKVQRIGALSEGIDGSEEYFHVVVRETLQDAEPSADDIESWLLPTFYQECRVPGGYFCNTVQAVPEKYNKSRFVFRVSHQYDV